jgi:hypothetical protein
MCLSSGYGDYLRDKFMQLVSQFELDAVKIDNCGYPEGTEPHQRIANFWDDCYGVGHQHVTPASHNESWKQYALILDSFRSMYPKLLIESIPCGLSQLDKFDVDWISDYFFPFRACGVNPDTDWPTEIHYMRTLNYYMSYTHPISTIHQGWVDPQAFCLELLCASVFGGNLWTGVTGFIEEATPEQKEVVKGWVRWHKENRRYLSVYQHLSPEGAPVIPLRGQQEGVDGFAHLLSDGGWIFLFNPTAEPREVTLELDLARYGIADVADISSGGRWRFDAKNRRLTMSQTVPAMGFTQSRLTARMG